MPRRREGFDYFVDKFEDSYYDDYERDYYEDSVPGRRRFEKLNRYTGEIQGRPQFINTSSIYTGPQQQPYGTVEFSALQGQGGLDPNSRPLGDQTMMLSTYQQNPALNPNPYVRQILETQQLLIDQQNIQKAEVNKRVDNLSDAVNSLADKINEVSKTIHETQTLSFKNVDEVVAVVEPAPTPAPVVEEPKPVEPAPTPAVATPNNSTSLIPTPAPVPTPTQQLNKPARMPVPQRTQQIRPIAPTATTNVKNVKPQGKKKKMSKGVLIGGIIGIVVAVALIVIGILMILKVSPFVF